MIKSISLIRRKAGVTPEEFRRHYEEVHAPLALTCLPGLKKYVRNYVVGDVFGAPADFDVASEFWYESADDVKASLAFYHSPAGQVLPVRERISASNGKYCVRIPKNHACTPCT